MCKLQLIDSERETLGGKAMMAEEKGHLCELVVPPVILVVLIIAVVTVRGTNDAGTNTLLGLFGKSEDRLLVSARVDDARLAESPFEGTGGEAVGVAELFEADNLILGHALLECDDAGQNLDAELLHQEGTVGHIRLEEESARMEPSENLKMSVEQLAALKLLVEKVNRHRRVLGTQVDQLLFMRDLGQLAKVRSETRVVRFCFP